MDVRQIVLAAASLLAAASCRSGEPVCANAGLYDETHVYVSAFESKAPVPVSIEPIGHQSYNPISLSPDGSKLAYFVNGDRSALHVSDISGTHRRFPLAADDPNSGGSRWENAHVVRIERGWRLMSEFSFYRLSDTGESAQRLRESDVGDDCSLSSDSKHVACVQGATAFVDEVKIFEIPMSTYSSNVGSFTLQLGQSVSSKLVPGTTVELKGYKLGTAHLSYQTDGVENSLETWERSGMFFNLNTDAGDRRVATPSSTTSGIRTTSTGWRHEETGMIYEDGTEIRVGDRVLINRRKISAVVEAVIETQDDIRESEVAVPGVMLLAPGRVYWSVEVMEDDPLVFDKRGPAPHA